MRMSNLCRGKYSAGILSMPQFLLTTALMKPWKKFQMWLMGLVQRLLWLLKRRSSDGEKEWSPKDFSDGGEDSLLHPFNPINQVFVLAQHDVEYSGENSGDCKVNIQGLPLNYPIVSASTLPGRQSYQPPYYVMNYSSPMDLNEMSPSIPKFFKNSSTKPQTNINQLHLSNNTSFLNASADSRTSISASPQSKFSCYSNLAGMLNNEEVHDSSSLMKPSIEPRPKVEAQSPIFKVRNEKLGDRVTALHQLVSPFGKTDTASVLFEAIEYIKFLHDQLAIEYIKFLHDQLGVLSTRYQKNGVPTQYQQKSDKSKDAEGLKHDLKSRGLCLVPVSSPSLLLMRPQQIFGHQHLEDHIDNLVKLGINGKREENEL